MVRKATFKSSTTRRVWAGRQRAGQFCALLLSAPWLAGTVRAQAPVITGLVPKANQLAVSRNAAVSASFSQPLSNAAATLGALRVFSQQAGGRKAGAATVSGSTLSFVPTTAFRPGETVSATLTTAVQGSGGAGLAQPRVFQFTTATEAGPGLFGSSTAVTVGSGATRVVTGDIDGDGDLDLLTANSGTTAVSVRRNNGAGAFSGTQEVTLTYLPSALVLADVDSDGDLDLLTASAVGIVSLRLNDSTGSFYGNQEISVGTAALDLVTGDVDGDGDLDLLTASGTGSGRVNVLLNNGLGQFSSLQSVVVGDSPRRLLLGDVDNDGDLDLVTTNYSIAYNNNVSVRLNNGAGVFGGGSQVLAGGGGYVDDVKLGDVDSDGDLDLLTASYSSSRVSVRLNNGSGTFTGTQEVDYRGRGPAVLELADVDGDGDLDLLTASQNGRSLSIRLNSGSGAFAPDVFAYTFPSITAALLGGSQEVEIANQLPSSLAVADVDGDGRLDLLATTSGSLGSVVSVNLALRALSVTPAAAPVGSTIVVTGPNLGNTTSVAFTSSTYFIVPGFTTGNTVQATNFVINSPTQLTVTVPVGAASGALLVSASGGATSGALFTVTAPLGVVSFSPTRNALNVARTTPVSATFSQALGPAATTQGLVRVFSQQASGLKTGTTTASGNTLTLRPSAAFKAGETVFTSLPTGSQVFQFTTATTPSLGLFGGGQEVGVGSGPAGVKFGDLDNDGDLDLLTANSGSNTVSIRRNNGQGVFSNGSEATIGSTARQLVLGDVDNDGDLDLLASTTVGTVSVRLNNGQGTFTGTQEVATPATDMALGDIDGDGDLDLVTNGGAVRLNNGSGVFGGGGNITVLFGSQRVILGDVDSDGDLDLLSANYYGVVDIVFNTGRGFAYNTVFANRIQVPAGGGGYVEDIKLGDVDGDGDLDLLTASSGSSRVSVRLNTGGTSFFGSQEVSLSFRGPTNLELADIDGDGDLDIVTTDRNTRSLGIRLNDGTGAFYGTREVPLPDVVPTSLALGDIDGDGDLDVATTQTVTNLVSVRFNQNTLRAPENPAGTVAGLDYAYYQNSSISQLPDFASLSPQKTGTVSYFDAVGPRLRTEAYALRFTGYVTVPADGYYTFFTNSDDGSQLFVGSQLVVDNNGTHGVQERTGTIGLQAGTHALTVAYFQSGGTTALMVGYTSPDGVKQPLAAANLRRVPSSSSLLAEATRTEATLQAYPNPSQGAFQVQYVASQGQAATLLLSDQLGRVVQQQQVRLQAGLNQLAVEARGIAPGLYQLVLRPALDPAAGQKVSVQP